MKTSNLAVRYSRRDHSTPLALAFTVALVACTAVSLEAGQAGPATSGTQPPAAAGSSTPAPPGVVTFNSEYSYEILDPTTSINRKMLVVLDRRLDGTIADHSVTVSGAVIAIMDYQHSDTVGKFGYLMRHPTASNEVGTNASEAVIHSAQLSFTAAANSWVTVYAELLYDPEQSFGAGTLTALARNQIELRSGYVLLGNLKKSPLYFGLGKMATPFGLTDTVNPFTASTVWHAFGGLAYGARAGYSKNGVNASFMGVEGGAQFRAANTPVDGTAVPSQLNNFVADANYTVNAGHERTSLLLGGSYQRGSDYCQVFPITHFSPCAKNNPAFDAYSRLRAGRFTGQAEFARTTGVWPGTFNPDLPQYAASRLTSWDIGGKYGVQFHRTVVDISGDFSRLVAGPTGAPWHRQNQLVAGVAPHVGRNMKMFAEYVNVAGYAPLNYLNGGNLGTGVTWSTSTAVSHVMVFGMHVAF